MMYRARSILSVSVLAAVLGTFAAEVPAQEPGDVSIDGAWQRVESNNSPADGMRIMVEGSSAVLTSTPAAISSSFANGDIVWMAIGPDGSLRVRGSDANYYDARMSFEGTDILHIDIDHTGAGYDQTWHRAGPSIDGDWVRVTQDGRGDDGLKVRVMGSTAEVRYLPPSVPGRIRVGSRLWQNIAADGALDVMGSDGAYRPARLTLDGDALHISGLPGGTQAWARPGAVDRVRTAPAP